MRLLLQHASRPKPDDEQCAPEWKRKSFRHVPDADLPRGRGRKKQKYDRAGKRRCVEMQDLT